MARFCLAGSGDPGNTSYLVEICLRLLENIYQLPSIYCCSAVKIDQYKHFGHKRNRPMAQSGDEVSRTVF
jgi:hypothetical protein